MGEEHTWTTPKTDWKISYDSEGNYTGDYFEPSDYNRIKNNLCCLWELAKNLYEDIQGFQDMGEDAYYGCPHELTASMMTCIQDNLEILNSQTVKKDVGKPVRFYPNQAGYLVDELNRIERMSLLIYTILQGQLRSKPRLPFRLCGKGGII